MCTLFCLLYIRVKSVDDTKLKLIILYVDRPTPLVAQDANIKLLFSQPIDWHDDAPCP